MKSFFASAAFRYILFPLTGIGFRIFVKCVQKNSPPEPEDFAVGLDVMSDALLMFVALDLERAVCWTKASASLSVIADAVESTGVRAHADVLVNQIAWAGGSIFVIFCVLMLIAYLKRIYGTDAYDEPTLFLGTVLPDIVAFLSLAGVAMYFSNGC